MPLLVDGPAIDVNVHYTTTLDYIVLLLDSISFVIVLWRLFAYNPVKNATIYRIALSFMALALSFQSANIIWRQFWHPFDTDFQSVWALKDIAIFVYVAALTHREWRARQISPVNEAATDFSKRDNDESVG